MRATLIVNPCASRVTEERLDAVARVLERAGELTIVRTDRRGHATELAREAAGADAIFAYGGDGLFNEVLNGATGPAPVGFVPGGHTNVLVRTLGLPRDPVAAAARLVNARTRRISLGRVNGRRFAFAAGVGVGAEAVRRIDELGRTPDGRRRGDLRLAGIVAARLLHGYEPALEITGVGRAAMVFVSNGQVFSCAGRAPVRLSPEARFELGLDMAAPVRVHLGTLARIVPRLALGRGLAACSPATTSTASMSTAIGHGRCRQTARTSETSRRSCSRPSETRSRCSYPDLRVRHRAAPPPVRTARRLPRVAPGPGGRSSPPSSRLAGR